MDLGLTGKRALVAGGSRGLGRAIALELANEGCKVVIASRNELALQQAATDIIEKTGGHVEPVVLDVQDPSSIQACVEKAVSLLGGLDILVNAAARTGGHSEQADTYASGSETGMVADFTEKVVGSLRLVRAAEPHFRAAGGGRIILLSGGAGRVRGGFLSAGVRNRSINQLAVTLANALGRYNIGCVSVAPGVAVTERQLSAHQNAAEALGIPLERYLDERAENTTLMKRLVFASDLAKSVCFLCSPVSWTINATVVELAGGSSPDIHYELEPHPPTRPATT